MMERQGRNVAVVDAPHQAHGVVIDGRWLTIDDVASVARAPVVVTLASDPATRGRIEHSGC
jgi:hypothetical protein